MKVYGMLTRSKAESHDGRFKVVFEVLLEKLKPITAGSHYNNLVSAAEKLAERLCLIKSHFEEPQNLEHLRYAEGSLGRELRVALAELSQLCGADWSYRDLRRGAESGSPLAARSKGGGG